MKMDLDGLWELVDEMLLRREMEQDEEEGSEQRQYLGGWCDAMRWVLETLEVHLHDEADDEW